MIKELPTSGIQLQLPVKIKLTALEKLAQKKLVGEFLEKEKEGETTRYAKITEVEINANPDYDLLLRVTLVAKTKLFKNRVLRLNVYVNLNFDPEAQELEISQYYIESENLNWLTDRLLSVTVNSLLKKIILAKSKVLLQPKLQTALDKINQKLMQKFEVKSGIELSGEMENLMVNQFWFDEKHLHVQIGLSGKLALDILTVDDLDL